MTTRVTIADFRAAAELLIGIADRTPVERSRALAQLTGGDVWLKCENLQRTGSFKIRGAYVRMARLSDDEKARGVVAAVVRGRSEQFLPRWLRAAHAAKVFAPPLHRLGIRATTRGLG